ncbi:type III secretion protein [Paraburkholderia kururiensis]|uniref:type III secretion protein n=1 Tax=Paraburkholderia kururiensis TaxID=984307 RepID=UPI001F33147B|nr:type III secretion protein [Paraburkholderia kururiensis]
MTANRRRIAALTRTTERRERLEETLRAALAARREEAVQLAAQRDGKAAEVQQARETLAQCHASIGDMMGGSAAFSLADLNAAMRYAEVVADRVRVLEADLAALIAACEAKQQEIVTAVRAIANNRGRIELCNERIAALRRRDDEAASDAADEEAEEAALARLAAAARAAREAHESRDLRRDGGDRLDNNATRPHEPA